MRKYRTLMNRFKGYLIILLLLTACKNEGEKSSKNNESNFNLKVERFEQKFYEPELYELDDLKFNFPYLFPSQTPDSVWNSKRYNEEEIELYKLTKKEFDTFEVQKKEIVQLFKNIKKYNAAFKNPKLITLITNLDFENKVIYADSLLLISIDMYLGKRSPVYIDFPEYISQNFDKSRLPVDIANAIINSQFKSGKGRQFLHNILNEGKKMYLLDMYVPNLSDEIKMGYNSEKMQWVRENEVQIWKYFIENELLYSTNADLYTRFIANAPFSKFYLDIDKESPGKVGVWLGWQIVKSYMKNNNVTLQQLLQTNAEDIFNKSKYKPKK